MNIKQEMEAFVEQELYDGLNIKDNATLVYVLVSLIQSGAKLHCLDKAREANFWIMLRSTNGIPVVSRYETTDAEEYTDAIRLVGETHGISTEALISNFKEDLISIETVLYNTLLRAYDEGYDIGFAFVEGLTYRYFSSGDSTGPLRITANLVEGKSGDIEVIFKYSTDNNVNMAFKNDKSRGSKL